MYLVSTPNLVKSVFSSALWQMNRASQVVYLTFDDGPHPDTTPEILKILARYSAKGTFFCVGHNVEKYPEVYRSILSEGHTIGNHTYHHVNGWRHSAKAYLEEIQKTDLLMDTKLFRPPYGKLRLSQYRSIVQDKTLVMWDVLSGDFDPKVDAQQCIRNVLDHSRRGSIIVLHDNIKSHATTREALPIILEELSKRKLKFKALDSSS